ncbi:MAG: hypothetical protein GEU76_01130 [Alphaproteobacteria bacterium]|nr:hypothetical protein [Alphaproteobacteria bacterium]
MTDRTSSRNPPGRDNRTSLPPVRSYMVPGGPLARNLDEVKIVKLATIERGGKDDWRPGRR